MKKVIFKNPIISKNRDKSFKDIQIEPIQKKSVVQDAISKIKELIDQEYFQFGERLPPERELARLSGISLGRGDRNNG